MSKVAIGNTGGTVDAGVGAAEKFFTIIYTCTISLQTHYYQDGPLLVCLGWPLTLEEALWMQEWELQSEQLHSTSN